MLATIELVAELADVPERGRELSNGLWQRLDAVPFASARRRVALVEWLSPLFAPGHWVPEQVERAGGVSVIGQAGERSRESSWEALAAADPEVVVLGLCGFDLPRSLEEWAAFEVPEPLTRTRAWQTGELWAIDGSAYVSRPGPRLVDGVEVLAGVLNGGADSRAVRLPTHDKPVPWERVEPACESRCTAAAVGSRLSRLRAIRCQLGGSVTLPQVSPSGVPYGSARGDAGRGHVQTARLPRAVIPVGRR